MPGHQLQVPCGLVLIADFKTGLNGKAQPKASRYHEPVWEETWPIVRNQSLAAPFVIEVMGADAYRIDCLRIRCFESSMLHFIVQCTTWVNKPSILTYVLLLLQLLLLLFDFTIKQSINGIYSPCWGARCDSLDILA